MPTSRAYGTRYAIHPNMLTHDLHGPHAVIINMDLRVHGHALYKHRHACMLNNHQRLLGLLHKYVRVCVASFVGLVITLQSIIDRFQRCMNLLKSGPC